MKNYLKIILVIFIAIIITVIVFNWNHQDQPIDSTEDLTIESPNKKYSRKYNSTEPELQSPVVDQEIKQTKAENDPIILKEGYARVKVLFTKDFNKEENTDYTFGIVVYKDHQEIYRAKKKENEYFDKQFKINENYQFYLFLSNTMSYHEVTIEDPETIIETHPKFYSKKIIVKNDFKNLFAEFNIGCFSFNEKYSFYWLIENELIIGEYSFYPRIKFPSDHQFCQLILANEFGMFTFNKNFEEIYNNKPLEIEVPILKEISIKILNHDSPIDLTLNLIPENFIMVKENDIEKIEATIKNSEATFFTNISLFNINLTSKDIFYSKFVPIKESITYVEFNLSKDQLKPKKIIIKNNPYGEKLNLFRYINKKIGGSFLGSDYGEVNQLKKIALNIFEYPSSNDLYREVLFFDLNDKQLEETNNDDNQPKRSLKQRHGGFLGVDFFKGNIDEEIEIDFSKQKFYQVKLKSSGPEIEPGFLVSLNEKHVLAIYEDGVDFNGECSLLLKKGSYRIVSNNKKLELIFSQNFEVFGDTTIQLTNEFEKNITSTVNDKEDEDSEKDSIYLSFKKELPFRNSLFQIFKNMNCFAEIKHGYQYAKLDSSYIMKYNDSDKTVSLTTMIENYPADSNVNKPPINEYIPLKLDSKLLQNSEILFLKSFAPNNSELQIINSVQNLLIENITLNRRADDIFKRHVFLNNFEFIILPPVNKPKEKIKTGFYGKVKIHFSNPLHHLFAFEILDENNLPQNTDPIDYRIFDNHSIFLDNITCGSCFEFNFLEFGTHQLEISDLTTGITYKYPFQVTEKYQEIDIK